MRSVNPTALVVAGLVVFVVTCASLLGLYALAPTKPDVAPLFAGIPGGIAALVAGRVAWNQRGHGQQLAQITHQTNGVLTARIRAAVGAELAAHDAEIQAAASRRPAKTTTGKR